jgi:hypothetical protein
MRRTFPLIATIAAEVAAVFGGAPSAVADTTTPEPVAVMQTEAARAEPPADPTPASDPAPEAPIDPVAADPGDPVTSTPPVHSQGPTFTVRTGRAGDPAAVASSLDGRSNATAGSSTNATTRGTGQSGTTTSTTPQHKNAGRARHSASTSTATAPPTKAPTVSSASTPATVNSTTPSAASTSSASSHVVVAGDNLWDIAASHLASLTGREVAALGTAEIVRYWVRVCEDNRSHLQSGDVSLIYAGEIVELPAP